MVVCVILQALMRRFPTLLQEIDVIAGTSTGGMLAALLGSGCTLLLFRIHTRISRIYKVILYPSISTNVTLKSQTLLPRVLIFTNFMREKYLNTVHREHTILG